MPSTKKKTDLARPCDEEFDIFLQKKGGIDETAIGGKKLVEIDWEA